MTSKSLSLSNWAFCLLSFVFSFTQSYAQLNESEVKASYLLNFLDNLTFENQSELDTLRILVVDDKSVYNALVKISDGLKIKNLSIVSYTEKTKSVQLVYISSKDELKFKEVASNNQKSVIVGNIQHLLTDIRFIQNKDESISFKINNNHLENKHIQASSKLIVYNSDKENLLSLIDSQETKLNELIVESKALSDELKKKEGEVAELNSKILTKEDRLKELNAANSQKTAQLNTMQNEILSKEKELTNINQNFAEQNQELDQLKTRLEDNYTAIETIADSVGLLQAMLDSKKKLVQENQALLNEQNKELSSQKAEIVDSDRKANRNLYFFLITGALTLLLIIVLIILNRENKAKRKALITVENQNQSIQEASKQKDEFISNLSHEVRSPLNAIIGYTDLIRKNIKNDETQKNLEYITMSSKNLLGMINDILDYRRIEEGKGKLEFDSFELESVVQVVFNTLKITAENKGLEYNLSYDNSLPQFVRSDSKKISQILLNLVSNAIKFTSDGKVEINIEKISSTDEKCLTRFSVQDTGIGIDKENQKIIFETFTQETDYTAKEFGGSGLGLSISRKLVELLETNINVSSEAGKGATFSFDLDLEIGERNDLSHQESIEIKVEKLCDHQILIVDDLSINRNLLKKQFSSKGCDNNLLFAENGLEALDVISKNHIDIILTDVRMPVMNGIELSKTLRKNNFSAPIIGVSANNSATEKEACLEIGMNGYIVKPYSFNDLLLEIAQQLNLKILRDNKGVGTACAINKFTFERLKTISESDDEFMELKENVITEYTSNIKELNQSLNIEIAHKNVNHAAYFGDEILLNLSRDIEIAIRNNNESKANLLIHEVVEKFKENNIEIK